MYHPIKQTIATTLLLCAPGLSLFAEQHTSSNECPTSWQPYISMASGAAEALANSDAKFVFIDRKGDVFDCLNMDPEPDAVAWLEDFHSGLPIDLTSPLPEDSSKWPINVCNTGRPTNGPYDSYYLVLLPTDTETLGLEICRLRVQNSLVRSVSVLNEALKGTTDP